MAYAVKADLEDLISSDKLRQMTDDDRDGVSDATLITDTLSRSDGLIDSYIGSRYVIPLSPVPPVITQITCQIALFWLFARKTVEVPRQIQDQYDAAIEWLKGVQDGTLVIPGATILSATIDSNRTYVDDRDFRKEWDSGTTDDEKIGTFGTFDDGIEHT